MGIARIKVSNKLISMLLDIPDDIEIEGTWESYGQDYIDILIKGDSIPPSCGRQIATIESSKTII